MRTGREPASPFRPAGPDRGGNGREGESWRRPVLVLLAGAVLVFAAFEAAHLWQRQDAGEAIAELPTVDLAALRSMPDAHIVYRVINGWIVVAVDRPHKETRIYRLEYPPREREAALRALDALAGRGERGGSNVSDKPPVE